MNNGEIEKAFGYDFPLISRVLDGKMLCCEDCGDFKAEVRKLGASYKRLSEHRKRRCMELSDSTDKKAARASARGTLRVEYLRDGLYPDGLHAEHEGDAGMDLRCSEGVALEPHSTAFVPCGLRVQLPRGTFGALRPRSGLARRHGVDVVEGTVDEGFRGEVGVTMRNSSDVRRAFAAGDRIAQLVVVPYVACDVAEGITDEDTDRGRDGYGSTGMA